METEFKIQDDVYHISHGSIGLSYVTLITIDSWGTRYRLSDGNEYPEYSVFKTKEKLITNLLEQI